MESPVPVVRFDSGTARYCVNCKWYARVAGSFAAAECRSPLNAAGKRDLVTGNIVPLSLYCENQRTAYAPDNYCGASGRWFEPRETAEAAE